MADTKETPCSECIKGSIHAGLPAGKEEPIHGLNTYIIGNQTSPKAVIVVYSDIFGLALPNNKLLCDAYAKEHPDWLIYMPDFFQGDPVQLKTADVFIPVDASKQGKLSKYTGMLSIMPNFLSWMGRHKEGPTNTICMTFLQKLRRESMAHGQKLGMVGFCWGGRYAIRSALESNQILINGIMTPLVDAVVALHPSNIARPDEVEKLVVPVSVGWGYEDAEVNIKKKVQMELINSVYQTKTGKTLPEIEHKVYRPGRHGFAVRGNPDDPAERKLLEDSHRQVVSWFEKWLR